MQLQQHPYLCETIHVEKLDDSEIMRGLSADRCPWSRHLSRNPVQLLVSTVLILPFLLLGVDSVNAKETTIKVFEHTDPDHGLSLTVVPINDKTTCRYFFDQDIIGHGLIAFYITLDNNSDKVLYLLRDRIKYNNVLREQRTMINQVIAAKHTETSSMFWAWTFGFLGGMIAEARNLDKAIGLSIMLNEVILSPGSSLQGAILFSFTDKVLKNKPRPRMAHHHTSSMMGTLHWEDDTLSLTYMPIRGSTLLLELSSTDGKRIQVPVTFGATYREETISRDRSRQSETVFVDELSKEMWPDW